MKILITNDDGVQSPGIQAVAVALADEAECLIVAPHKERSAAGHSISLYHDILVEEVDIHKCRAYSVEGTPADCVKFAVCELAKGKFDLVISGINIGINSGVSVYYSGTVSAAREGLINGIPAVAISQAKEPPNEFSYAQKLLRQLVAAYRDNRMPKDVLLNINIPKFPPQEIKGIKTTIQAHSRFSEWYEGKELPAENGKKPYALRGGIEVLSSDGTSDEEALQAGYVSITPLQIDSTYYKHLPTLEKWTKTL